MSSMRFAYRAIVRVYLEDEYNPPKLCYEAFEEELLTDTITYDGHNEQEFILEDVEWPGEGYFSVWIIGKFCWSRDYWGEVDMDVEIDTESIGPASMSEMHCVTGYECYNTPQPGSGLSLFDFN